MKTIKIIIVALVTLLLVGILLWTVVRPSSSSYEAPSSCVDLSTCQASCGAGGQKYVGINLTGFDSGDTDPPAQSSINGWSCIPSDLIDWNKQGQVNIVRIPILPNRILKTTPDSSTVYSEDLFNPIWDGPTTLCSSNNQYWNTGTYMTAVRYCVQNGINVIIDAHQDQLHLCPFTENVQLTGDQFTAMWRLIATYISKNVDAQYQSLIWCELYNEPVNDGCLPLSDSDWNSNYVVPAIRAIRAILPTNYILATTYGDYSGVHSWPSSNTLDNLIAALQSANYTPNDKIVIAGHQYCDSSIYSGGADGCDPQSFNASLYQGWVQQTQQKLKGFYWMLTEGNAKCNNTSCATNHGNLYVEFLQYIMQQPQCMGFTVWMSSIGDPYGGSDMGSNPTYFASYTVPTMYQANGNYYQFRKQFVGS